MKTFLRSTLNRLVHPVAVAVLLAAAPPVNAAPGDLDPLDADLRIGDEVLAAAVQPDGKTIIAGRFASVLGVPRSNIARLNADGTLDMGFDPGADDTVLTVAVQADGKLLFGGEFTSLQPNGAGAPVPRSRIARLNADGTLDTGFDPGADDTVQSVAVQADGKVLLGGAFTTLQPNGAVEATTRRRIARINANGTLDPLFDPNLNDPVFSVAVQADGKVLLGGAFTTLNGVPRNGIARVNANGTLDPEFDPGPNTNVLCVAVQPDGKVLLGGWFTTLHPNGEGAITARQRIARVNADGTLDTGFDPGASGDVFSVAVQADGKVLLGGSFTSLQPNGAGAPIPRSRLARVNADGTLDSSFDPKPDLYVTCVAVQADGKVLLGGGFNSFRPNDAATATVRKHFARLLNDPAMQTLSAPDETQNLWQRGGASPELSRVTFDLSTDGGANWTPLGAGTRIGATANWQRTGLALPVSGQLRARGVTSGGLWNGSSGLIEQVVAFSFDTTAPAGGTMTLMPASRVDAGATLTVAFDNWTDPGLPLSYAVLVDDVVVAAQGAAASRNFTGPGTTGTHILKGRIFDANNNVTEVMQNFTVNTHVNITGPAQGSISCPGDGVILSATTDASTTAGPVQLEFFIDGVSVGTAPGNSASVGWIATPGMHVLRVVDSNSPGASTTSRGRLFFVGGAVMPIDEVVPLGASWRYFNSADLGTAWRQQNFDDRTFAQGNAQLGFGDGDEATVINGGTSSNQRRSTYLRHRFTPAAPFGNYASIKLLRDDGAVVYLNGTEFARSNMPDAPAVISYNTPATSNIGVPFGIGESILHPFQVPVSLFVAGQNVLAVEVHQSGSTSDFDLSFDMALYSVTYSPDPPESSRAGNEITLRWPDYLPDWILEESPDLITWEPVTTHPSFTLGLAHLTLGSTPLKKFFRLRQESR